MKKLPVERSFYPSLGRRYVGAIIDGICAFSLAILSVKIFNFLEIELEWISYLVFYGILVCYEPILTSKKQTAAQYLLKYQVMRLEEGLLKGDFYIRGRIGLFAAFWRFFIKWFLGFISLLTVPRSKGYRAIHDKASDAVVLNVSFLTENIDDKGPKICTAPPSL